MAQFFKPQKKSVAKEKKQLKIDSLNHDGIGVSRDNNKVCFVEGALPGEIVLAQPIQAKAKFERLTVQKIIESNIYRVKPFCEHYQLCGGCQLQHLAPEQQMIEKQKAVSSLFDKFLGTSNSSTLHDLNWQPAIESAPLAYRRTARIAVFYDKRKNELLLGYRQKGSKKIINIKNCLVLESCFSDIFSVFSPLLAKLKAAQSITHLQLYKTENQALIVIRHIKALNEKDIKSIVAATEPYKWQLVFEGETGQYQFYNKNPDEQVEINKNKTHLLHYYLDEFDLKLNFSLDNFIQVNHKVNRLMLKQAIDWLNLNRNEKILDLFCGIGNFSLPMAKIANKVVGIEGVASSVEMAKFNALDNKVTNTEFYCQDLNEPMVKAKWFKQEYDVLLLDPSRAGAFDILSQLKLKRFSRILYVSCDPVTLARDSKLIIDAGFKIDKVSLMNMFPHTGHVETMALFIPSRS
ncbi:23S rRNA (uracil(1939)-C(5))-methyltransferase RlmD [Pseudoalteromonas denitrificans]|uniref:23S rRNA (uracil(1939)-C(5))-methyltransferase RlmD n=1 Tax=Pseudoalteromonas denitrificans DSM 6059 TaxID=1123010 RepID=A0A1I1S9W5_9GAMM|nr:23S rRNA (uracil(1939)-C(5))-methyltransferase RlmD [Pseudoalteromonas denitrificans]SFD43291.1 23S rRNA m(5)U-1939 methyltransferase [Pseudoalteromonas denitrificans DSM 6059]